MKIRMELKSDAIFGNGASVPGGEDIAVLTDEQGFPYYKGGTFKGIFREELYRYLNWTGLNEKEIESKITELLGKSGDDEFCEKDKLVFSDFCISDAVKECVCLYSEIECDEKDQILVENVLKMIKWVGTMRNRGFGKIQISIAE